MAEFVTVMKEFTRMCGTVACMQCGVNKKTCNPSCIEWARSHPEEAEKIIMDWAAEHPQKTLADQFYELFPGGLKNGRNEPHICPRYLGWIKECDDYDRCACDSGFVCTKWRTIWEEKTYDRMQE